MQFINHTVRLTSAAILALLLAGYVSTAEVQATETKDVSKINSAIHIESDEHVGDVSSINGSIRIRKGAVAANVDTVNGGIELEDGSTVDDAATVNGGISVGENVTVNGTLETVNGGISIDQGSTVADNVETVNGGISLRNVRVRENIQTTNGDITLQQGSVVDGDIIIKAHGSWLSRVLSLNTRNLDLIIDASSEVKGDIHLYKEVNLRIADGAKVGKIIEHF